MSTKRKVTFQVTYLIDADSPRDLREAIQDIKLDMTRIDCGTLTYAYKPLKRSVRKTKVEKV